MRIKRSKKDRKKRYSMKIVKKVCVRIAEGESLRTIVLDDDMPSMPTIFKWLNEHAEFRALYQDARAAMADSFFEKFLDHLDDVESGRISPQAGRVLLDGEKWVMGRLNCPKYGETQMRQVSVSTPDGKSIQITHQVAAMDLASLEEAIQKAEKLT
jgi:hypothetical protein